MSSERFRERLLSGDRATGGGQPVPVRTLSAPPAPSPFGTSLIGSVVDPPLSRSASWKPQNWRLRTKLVALTVIPLVLALVLAGLEIADAATSSHAAALREAIIIGAFVLVALVLLLVLARSILKPLRVLRASAFDVADRRLPAAIELLRTTDGRSGDIKVEPVPVHSREDVGQVARAFDAVHSEAVRLASEQAALRANVNDMFINLSRRSQSLVERQLRHIDDLERGEQDPDRLAALFRLDHLATRMRRNGENLLVLAGSELRRRSGEPVAVLDVLRAAVSEIEDYQRVSMQPLPRATVSGLAVNDIVHLVAELLDNATTYSDPETRVTLSARMTDDGGLAIDIVDEGTGIPRARLVEINQRLAAPPPIDVSVSRQMGLFVVGRLASRHGITVYLTSPGGSGVTVTVTLPRELIATGMPGIPMREDTMGRSYAPPTPVLDADGRDRVPQPAAAPPPARPADPGVAALDGGLLDSPAVTSGHLADTPIFNAMLSKWFTERQEPVITAEDVSEPAGVPGGPAGRGWESEADAGWKAAAVASAPAADELTPAGLPRRRPGALLVPGSVGTNATTTPTPSAAARNAETIRDRMSSYQRGLTLGRHLRPPTPQDQVIAGGGLGRHASAVMSDDQSGADHDQDDATTEDS